MSNEIEFVELVKNNEGLIHKVTGLYTDTAHDREDLYQEIIYQLWKSYKSFKGDSKITTWLYKVALNTAMVNLKKRKKRKNTNSIDDQVLEIAAHDNSIESEKVEFLTRSIKKLNEIERTIMVCYLEGKSHDEISQIVGFNKSNVGTRIGRIKNKLREQLKSEEDGI
ncbi:MAG: RNA polymerase sigma factor [Ekhidna sp.]